MSSVHLFEGRFAGVLLVAGLVHSAVLAGVA